MPRVMGRQDQEPRMVVGRKREPTPSKQTFLWDTILLVLQPPLDLRLGRTLDLPHPLYDFQVPGVKFLAKTKPGALLGDDMGLGKTIQAIVALRLLFQSGRISRALVACPKSVLRQWERELAKWAPVLRYAVIHGPREIRRPLWARDAHVYVTTYGTLRQDIDTIQERAASEPGFRFDVAVLDEITNIKNPTAKQTVAARQLPRDRGWGLSGTPLVLRFINNMI